MRTKLAAVLALALCLLSVPAFAAETTGLTFTERLSGSMTIAGNSVPADADLTAVILDVNSWYSNPDHVGELHGQYTVGGTSAPVTGTLALMQPDPSGGYALVYRFASQAGSADLSFSGQKTIDNTAGNRDMLVAVTTLKGASSASGLSQLPTELVFDMDDPSVTWDFVTSFHVFQAIDGQVTNASVDIFEQIDVYGRFLDVFFAGVAEEYLLPWKYF